MVKKFLQKVTPNIDEEELVSHTNIYVDPLKEEYADERREFSKMGLSTN